MNPNPYSPEQLKALIPWYLNGSLSEEQKCAMETWLRNSKEGQTELAAWHIIHTSVRDAPRRFPSNNLREKIIVQAKDSCVTKKGNSVEGLVQTLILSLLVLFILWLTIRPGIILNWTVQDGDPSGFRVYRALQGSENFKLVGEIPASINSSKYAFEDMMPLPVGVYKYRIQGIEPSGLAFTSLPVSGSVLNVLISQLAMVVTSLILGYGLARFTNRTIFSSSKEVLQG